MRTKPLSYVEAPIIQSLPFYRISFGSRDGKETDGGDFVNDAYSVQYPASSEAPPRRPGGESEARPTGGRSSSGPSLVIALGQSFAGTFMAAAFFKLCQDLLGFVSPQILKYVAHPHHRYQIRIASMLVLVIPTL